MASTEDRTHKRPCVNVRQSRIETEIVCDVHIVLMRVFFLLRDANIELKFKIMIQLDGVAFDAIAAN